MSLAVGDHFPTVPVHTTAGPVDLSERWSQGPLVVAFHRLWCPFCQAWAIQLAEARGALRAAGGDAVLVYRDDEETVERARSVRGIPFTCASDHGHALEVAARVPRFRLRRYAAFSPARLVAALRSGGRVGLVRTDLLQGRGTYVIAPDGRIAYAHISASAADTPPIADVLAAVRRAGAGVAAATVMQ